jgi:hypothetical protein
MNELSDNAGRLEALARALIGSAIFDRIARNVGTEGAIRAAYHRLLAEQHQERARWTSTNWT